VQQAHDEWDLSTSYANQGKYQDAIACINRADGRITEANAVEATYTTL